MMVWMLLLLFSAHADNSVMGSFHKLQDALQTKKVECPQCAEAQKKYCEDLASYTCARKKKLPDPTGEILRKSKAFRAMKNGPDRAFQSKIKNEIFPKIQKLLIDQMSARISDENVRENYTRKISNIELRFIDCQKDPIQEYERKDILMLEGLAYKTLSNSISICAGYGVSNKSIFSIVSRLAHETSHAIDMQGSIYPYVKDRSILPKNGDETEVRARKNELDYALNIEKDQPTIGEIEAAYPMKSTIECLRSKDAAGAWFPGLKPEFAENGKYKELNAKIYFFGDQINETFADYMSAEVLSGYFADSGYSELQSAGGYESAFRGLCIDSTPDYLSAQNRINRVLLSNPNVRTQMGCPPEHSNGVHYCK